LFGFAFSSSLEILPICAIARKRSAERQNV
jgi:hypothetical protein